MPSTPRPLLEPLSPRLLLAAPEAIPVLHLIGFDQRGSAWTYESKYAVAGSDFDDVNGRGEFSVAVRDNLKRIRGNDCVMVDVSSDGVTATTAWFTNKRGTYLASTFLETEIGDFRLNLGDTRVAPKSLTLGQTETRTSRVSATIDPGGDFLDLGFDLNSLSFKGEATTTWKLTDRQTVTVPAGTFDAVHGSFTASYEGSVKARVAGVSVKFKVEVSAPMEFWAVEGRGIVLSSVGVEAKAEPTGLAGLVLDDEYTAEAWATNKLRTLDRPAVAVARSLATPAPASVFSTQPLNAATRDDLLGSLCA
jgi:hypothetical protein